MNKMTLLPRKLDKLTGWPSSEGRVKSGAGSPTPTVWRSRLCALNASLQESFSMT